MSTLTKVLVILVSLASIFLCGMVLVFVGSSNNYKQAYLDQRTIAEGAMIVAEAAEMKMTRSNQKYEQMINSMQEANLAQMQVVADLQRDLSVEKQKRIEAENKVSSAVSLSESVQQANVKMHEVERQLQGELENAFRQRTTAEAQVISLNQQLNHERAKVEQLNAIRRRQDEKVAELEEENLDIRKRLQSVTVASREFAQAEDGVEMAAVGPTGVPIRGEIKAIDQDGLASITVGSSSGVREGTRFQIVRDGEYLGSLIVKIVEPREAAGRMEIVRGEVQAGDKVTTGFD